MKNWISEQMDSIISSWSIAIKKHYPKDYPDWSDPQNHIKALNEKWNYLEAVEFLKLKKIIGSSENLKILDLGAGTGWLSAYLSQFDSIVQIDALDSDKNNLNYILPEIVKLFNGKISKINSMLGLFTPLLVNDDYYDFIFASSSIHHSDNIFGLLKELKRVLKKGGKLFILNEVPIPYGRYLFNIIRACIAIIFKTFKKNVDENEINISAQGILYDPYLRDHQFSYYHWERAIKQAGFKYEFIKTPYFPYKNKSRQKIKLTNIVCY